MARSDEHPSSHRVGTSAGLDEFDTCLPMPNFFIVGAPKAGTTSLHGYLKRHPDVFMPDRKELHYFSGVTVAPEFDNFRAPIRSGREYQELFKDSKGYKLVGDASSSYLSNEDAGSRIKAEVPNAKIIISLRNPVQRAFSHYLMESREGRETRSFEDSLAVDMARKDKSWGTAAQYIELGMYYGQVKRYLTLFGRNNVLVILFEDLTRDTAAVMAEVAQFLGIDASRFPEASFSTVYNRFAASRGPLSRWLLRLRPLRLWARRRVPRSLRHSVRDNLLFKDVAKPELGIEVKRSLARVFEADLDKLESLLGRNLAKLRSFD